VDGQRELDPLQDVAAWQHQPEPTERAAVDLEAAADDPDRFLWSAPSRWESGPSCTPLAADLDGPGLDASADSSRSRGESASCPSSTPRGSPSMTPAASYRALPAVGVRPELLAAAKRDAPIAG